MDSEHPVVGCKIRNLARSPFKMRSITHAPLFSGMLFDSTQSYDATFYIAGVFFLSAGIISVPLHRIKRWEEQSSGQGVRDPVMPAGHV